MADWFRPSNSCVNYWVGSTVTRCWPRLSEIVLNSSGKWPSTCTSPCRRASDWLAWCTAIDDPPSAGRTRRWTWSRTGIECLRCRLLKCIGLLCNGYRNPSHAWSGSMRHWLAPPYSRTSSRAAGYSLRCSLIITRGCGCSSSRRPCSPRDCRFAWWALCAALTPPWTAGTLAQVANICAIFWVSFNVRNRWYPSYAIGISFPFPYCRSWLAGSRNRIVVIRMGRSGRRSRV